MYTASTPYTTVCVSRPQSQARLWHQSLPRFLLRGQLLTRKRSPTEPIPYGGVHTSVVAAVPFEACLAQSPYHRSRTGESLAVNVPML
jgi:hypothetical protein